jgi:hypothetical protein
MILKLLKPVVKATLHQAAEERLLEIGAPIRKVDELRAQRERLATQDLALTDALAARRQDVEVEQVRPASCWPGPSWLRRVHPKPAKAMAT